MPIQSRASFFKKEGFCSKPDLILAALFSFNDSSCLGLKTARTCKEHSKKTLVDRVNIHQTAVHSLRFNLVTWSCKKLSKLCHHSFTASLTIIRISLGCQESNSLFFFLLLFFLKFLRSISFSRLIVEDYSEIFPSIAKHGISGLNPTCSCPGNFQSHPKGKFHVQPSIHTLFRKGCALN